MKPCSPWVGAADPNGYGRRRWQGKTELAHRVAYCEHHGVDIASIAGQVVRHTCDYPPCCEGTHLILGTHQDNTNDKIERGRQPLGDTHHHSKMTEEQAAFIRSRFTPRHPEYSGRALARRFGVSPQTICDIIKQRHRKETT